MQRSNKPDVTGTMTASSTQQALVMDALQTKHATIVANVIGESPCVHVAPASKPFVALWQGVASATMPPAQSDSVSAMADLHWPKKRHRLDLPCADASIERPLLSQDCSLGGQVPNSFAAARAAAPSPRWRWRRSTMLDAEVQHALATARIWTGGSDLTMPSLHFESSAAAAAAHNARILARSQSNLAKVIQQESGTVLAPGSEFCPKHLLEPLTSQHPICLNARK